MDKLFSDQTLAAGSELVSQNGQHRAVMQSDGNFVIYRINGTAKWATGTNGLAIGGIIMQGDGNLVMYDQNGAVWHTGTHGNAGVFLIMQDDGNLVIYNPDWVPLWASGTNVTMMRVTGFMPSTNGFHFANSFNHAPDIQINILGLNVAIGDAANGLCGGMVFAARDFFQAGHLPPSRSDSPNSGILFDYLVGRLFDSFNIPIGPLRYMALMSPDLPDHETDMSEAGFAPHGRAWVTIVEEWPLLRAGLDSGVPVPMALILLKDRDPFKMGENHQVLAFGYDIDGNDLSILAYDPNFPDNNTVRINLNIGNPRQSTRIIHSNIGVDQTTRTLVEREVHAFFLQQYSPLTPPFIPVADPVLPDSIFTIRNATLGSQIVRVFNPTDTAMIAPLPASEFEVPAAQERTWVFHRGLPAARVTANGRFIGTATPGSILTIIVDDTVEIRNAGSVSVSVRIYKEMDTLMWGVLPGGSFNISGGELNRYTIPVDVTSIKVIANGQTFTASRGEVISISS